MRFIIVALALMAMFSTASAGEEQCFTDNECAAGQYCHAEDGCLNYGAPGAFCQTKSNEAMSFKCAPGSVCETTSTDEGVCVAPPSWLESSIFGPCSATCGNAVKSTTITCSTGNDQDCASLVKPTPTQQSCNFQACDPCAGTVCTLCPDGSIPPAVTGKCCGDLSQCPQPEPTCQETCLDPTMYCHDVDGCIPFRVESQVCSLGSPLSAQYICMPGFFDCVAGTCQIMFECTANSDCMAGSFCHLNDGCIPYRAETKSCDMAQSVGLQYICRTGLSCTTNICTGAPAPTPTQKKPNRSPCMLPMEDSEDFFFLQQLGCTPYPVSDVDNSFLAYAGMNLAGASGTAGNVNPFMYGAMDMDYPMAAMFGASVASTAGTPNQAIPFGMFEDSEDVTNYMAMNAMAGGAGGAGLGAGVKGIISTGTGATGAQNPIIPPYGMLEDSEDYARWGMANSLAGGNTGAQFPMGMGLGWGMRLQSPRRPHITRLQKPHMRLQSPRRPQITRLQNRQNFQILQRPHLIQRTDNAYRKRIPNVRPLRRARYQY